jgi:thiol:disulfide interchange protein DsbA
MPNLIQHLLPPRGARRRTGLFALLATLLAAIALPAAAADGYREVTTDVRSPDGSILVQEFFWYGCPHCYHLEDELRPWVEGLEDDVRFERRALALGQHWLPLTRAFYAAETLDALKATHTAMFETIHEDRTRFDSVEAIADFYADRGVDRQAFLDAFEGFGVQNEIRKTVQTARDAGVTGVPALLIDGRFLVTGKLAGGHAEMIEVADALIERVRDERD